MLELLAEPTYYSTLQSTVNNIILFAALAAIQRIYLQQGKTIAVRRETQTIELYDKLIRNS